METINQIEPLFFGSDRSLLKKYINSNAWFTEHKVNQEFETKFAKLVKTKYAVTFPNGTVTLFAILKALDVKISDTVLVPSYTMVATANIVKLAGAKLDFVDICSKNLCMCSKSLELKLKRKKIKVVIYVTLNGRTGNINEIKSLCKKYNVSLVEDSAHSIGSYFKSKHHGTFGLASSFSFSMPKIITTGQGGMVCTNNPKIFKKLKLIKNFGRKFSGEDEYINIGYNFKFTDLQAQLGISQLKTIKFRIKRKKEIFKLYFKYLKNIKDIKIINFFKEETPWFVDIYCSQREDLFEYLNRNGIKCRKVYPSLNKLKFFKNKTNCKVSEYYCSRGLWLPSSINLKNHQIKKICMLIEKFYE